MSGKKARLTEEVAAEVRRLGPAGVKVRIRDRNTVDVEVGPGNEVRADLGNLRRALSAPEANRRALVASFARSLTSDLGAAMAGELTSAGPGDKVLPVLRRADYGSEQGINEMLAHREFAPGGCVAVFYAEDLPESVSYVTTAKAGELGELEAQAVSNLAELACRKGVDVEELPPGGIYRVGMDGFYDTSLLLLDDFITGMEERLGISPLAACPFSASGLCICEARPEKLELLEGVGRRLLGSEAHPITSRVFIYGEEERAWRPYGGGKAN